MIKPIWSALDTELDRWHAAGRNGQISLLNYNPVATSPTLYCL